MRKLFTWELSVRVWQDEWVRVYVLRQKEVRLLLWDDQGIPIGHPGLALSEQEPGKPADPDNVIIRAGLQENNPYLEVGPEPDNHWEDKLEPKPIRQNVKKDRGNVLNTCRELGQTRDKGSRWRGSPWIPWWRPTQTEAQYLSCYASVPKKEGGIFDILIRFTLKKAWTFLKMASTATKVWFGQSKRATLFKGTCFKILLLIFACFLETASQSCVGRWQEVLRSRIRGSVHSSTAD